MRILKVRQIGNVLSCMLMAVFVVSTFSNYYLVGKVGFCAIEIILIPLLLIYNKYLRKIKGKDIFFASGIIFILWALAYVFLSQTQFATIFSTVRSYLIFFLSFFLFLRNPIKYNAIKYIYWIALISKVADLIGALAGLQLSVSLDGSAITNMNILTTPIILAYAYRCKGMVHFILVSLLCLFVSFFSGTRGIMLYTCLNIACCLIFKQFSFISSFKKILAIGVLSISLISIYFASENFVYEYSSNLHYRMYSKVLEHDEVVTGDNDRKEHYSYLFEHIDEVLFPHGMATRASETVNISSNRILWSVRDSSLVEIIYTFGVFSIILFFFLFKLTFSYIKRRNNNVVDFILSICLVNIITCIPMGYGLLITPPIIFTLGAELGLALSFRQAKIY